MTPDTASTPAPGVAPIRVHTHRAQGAAAPVHPAQAATVPAHESQAAAALAHESQAAAALAHQAQAAAALAHESQAAAAPAHHAQAAAAPAQPWPLDAILALFDLPFQDLILRAQTVHRSHFPANRVQLSTLLSIKTGGCSEDCAYCAQSSHHDADLKAGKLMPVNEVVAAARAARAAGSNRFCMGAAWRSPQERHLEHLTQMVREVKALGLETCMTLGMLDAQQAQELRAAGLDYYNHNLDTDPGFYGNIVTTRTYEDRLQTLRNVRAAGISVCCGGILGMGESRAQRAGLIAQLANLHPYPESVPINHLVPIEGTPLEHAAPLDPLEFVRTIAVARITMPRAVVRLSAGREQMGEAVQALAFLAGANSIFYGDHLLTTENPQTEQDLDLLRRLGMEAGYVEPLPVSVPVPAPSP